MSSSVGFVGVGRMGKPMLKHVAKAGFETSFYDTNPTVRIQGSSKASSLKELAGTCDIILVVVGTDQQVKDCFFKTDGLFAGSVKGKVFVIVSTISPETLRDVGKVADRKGAKVLDAPVCWGEPGAINGHLVSYVGGEKRAFEKCRRALEAYSKGVFYLGPLGSGLVAKTANNHLMWICRFANLEMLSLVGSYFKGDLEALHKALLAGTCSNRCLERLSAGGDIPWAVKDLDIILRLARKNGLRADFAKVASRAVRNKGLVEFNRRGLAWLETQPKRRRRNRLSIS